MNKIKTMVPYLVINAFAFYILPLIIMNTGDAMFVLLMGIPFICFVSAVCYGIKEGFHPLYALIVAMLFLPTISIFYNSTAGIYISIYGLLAFFGNVVGNIFHK